MEDEKEFNLRAVANWIAFAFLWWDVNEVKDMEACKIPIRSCYTCFQQNKFARIFTAGIFTSNPPHTHRWLLQLKPHSILLRTMWLINFLHPQALPDARKESNCTTTRLKWTSNRRLSIFCIQSSIFHKVNYWVQSSEAASCLQRSSQLVLHPKRDSFDIYAVLMKHTRRGRRLNAFQIERLYENKKLWDSRKVKGRIPPLSLLTSLKRQKIFRIYI